MTRFAREGVSFLKELFDDAKTQCFDEDILKLPDMPNYFAYLREALLMFVHGFELGFLLLLLLRIIIDFCEGTMNPRHIVLSTGSLKSCF